MWLMVLDIGNTSITVGFFRGGHLVFRGRMPTRAPLPAGEYAASARRLLRRVKVAPARIEAVVISSVVPKAAVALETALRGLRLPKPLLIGRDLPAPVLNRYRVPSQVGQDRLVNAAAACFLYRAPAIVVDFGTATTIDLVSGKREYLGGLIVPGIEISLEALSARAALLPRIRLTPPKELLGRDTVSSMRSGIFFGYGALCDGLVRMLQKSHAPRATVIATGGYAVLLAPYCKTLKVIDPDLTLQGLRICYAQKFP